jgi:hypothetical protein
MATKTISSDLAVNESKFRKQGMSLVQQAKTIKVTSAESYEEAIEFGRGVGKLIDSITEFFAPLKRSAKAAHTALCDKEKETLAIPRQAEEAVSGAIRVWRQAQAQKAAEEAERERKRLQIQAEKDRREAAEALRQAGEKKAAKEVLATAIVVPEVEVARVAPKVAGVRLRTRWHFEIVDVEKIERRFLVPSEQLIRAEVQEKKAAAIDTIPGVRVWSTEETDY